MKPVNKVLLILIGIVLSYWAVCLYAADTKLPNLTELLQGNNDMLLYVVNDPNGSPVDRKIGFDEMMSAWIGSTAVTTLGTITTGTWQGTDVGTAYGGTGASTLNDLIALTTHTTGNYALLKAKAEARVKGTLLLTYPNTANFSGTAGIVGLKFPDFPDAEALQRFTVTFKRAGKHVFTGTTS